jgi:tripartite-type tricarboxylate transporter receptor subunit TctC
MRYMLIAAASLVMAVTPPDAISQSTYPTKSIRFVVPVTTGGPSDLVARLLGEKLSVSLGKQVIIDNRPGASNTLGAAMVAKAEPDGYTLLQAAANMATVAILMTDLPFDSVKDFAPISLTHLTPYVIVVSAQSPVKSLPELLKFIKDNPGKITYGTTGEGSPQQLATLLFAQTAGGLGNITEVAYKGSSAAHPDLIANRISFMIDPLAAAGPHVKAGFLRALAVTTAQRNPSYPDIPTAIESGVSGYDFSSWGGVFAPARTPRAIVQKLNAEIAAALTSTDLRKRFADMGLVAKESTPDEFSRFLQSEISRWRGVLTKKP